VGRDGGVVDLIWVRRKRKYFCKRGWTPKSPDSPSGKSRLHLIVLQGARTQSISLGAKVRYAVHIGLNADIGGGPRSAQQRKCPPHSFTSSASANGTGGAVTFGCNASER